MYKPIAALLLSVMGPAAFAGPQEYVFTPIVEEGEREVDLKFGRATDQNDYEGQGSIGFGTAVTSRWFVEGYGVWERAAGAHSRFTAFEFESKFQFTNTGEYPVDVGLITELEIPRDSSGQREFVIGPLLQAESGRVQYNFNVLFERKFGGELAPGEDRDTVLRYQGQVKYRLQPEFEFGLQALGEVGKWNDWESRRDQAHRIGPAVFGKVHIGEGRKIVYNAGWLFGATRATPDNSFRLQVEFEF